MEARGRLSNIKRIAIIGAGPTGVAFGKLFLAEKYYDAIDIYEQRSNVGGIWNLSSNERSRSIAIPQTNPRYGDSCSGQEARMSLELESPLYDYLETNIPKPLMAYSDTPFEQNLPLFPKHHDVLRYLEQYAEPVKHLVLFGHQVIDLWPEQTTPSSSHQPIPTSKWHLTVQNVHTNVQTSADYDAVVVANGHYTVPHVPSIAGLAIWNQRYPGVVIHSKAYRRPQEFAGQRVLVIGNSASGLDIAAQLAPYARHPVYLASRSASQLAPSGGGPSWRKDVPEIEEFLVDAGDRAVRTKSGDVLDGFDAVIFATGYFYSFPFIRHARACDAKSGTTSKSASSSSLPSSSAGDAASPCPGVEPLEQPNPLAQLITTGLRTHDVYQHFLHIDYPTLALPVLNLKIIPFPLAENQAAVIARLWSGRLELPPKATMRQWEFDVEQRLSKANRLRPAPNTASGDSVALEDDQTSKANYEGGFHTLVFPEDASLINSLYQWAASAQRRDGLENDGIGKLGTFWDEERVWMRGQFADIKAAYARHGEKRFGITKIELLGEEWEHGFQRWQRLVPKEDQQELFRHAAVACR